MFKKIFLTGFMGSGKSKIGNILADRLNIKFVDTDDYIELKSSKTIAQIFEEFGENKFRIIESEIVLELLQNKESSVISLGGGSLVKKQNLDLVEKMGLLIYIKSGLEEIWERTKNKTKRPLLLINCKLPSKVEFMEKSKILMEERRSGYNRAKIIIDRDGKEAEDVVGEIISEMKKLTSPSSPPWQGGKRGVP